MLVAFTFSSFISGFFDNLKALFVHFYALLYVSALGVCFSEVHIQLPLDITGLIWYGTFQVVCHDEPQKYKTFLVEVDRLSIAMSVTKVVGDIPGSV